jgi:hypothetical protein
MPSCRLQDTAQPVINLTFAEGRKHNATHFVAIDVDEVISALWLRGSLWWDTLAAIRVGSTMYERGLLCLLELSLNCLALPSGQWQTFFCGSHRITFAPTTCTRKAILILQRAIMFTALHS